MKMISLHSLKIYQFTLKESTTRDSKIFSLSVALLCRKELALKIYSLVDNIKML